MTKIKIKYIIFCILVITLTLVFWYYVSCFCAVYKNTQKALIKDTFITFGITLIYPFIISFIPALFRTIALENDTVLGPSSLIIICLYQVSQIIVFIL